MNEKDFTATASQISLHGLGFIQIKLPGNRRLHVWHPDLPRRSCFAQSSIHNHRFSFESQVIAGNQVNRRFRVVADSHGGFDRISHDGPRSERGGRHSYVAERVRIIPCGRLEEYGPGATYRMDELEYHDTPNDGIVITLMKKLREGSVHASSLIEHGYVFDQSFDRFQHSEAELWAFVVDAFKRAG